MLRAIAWPYSSLRLRGTTSISTVTSGTNSADRRADPGFANLARSVPRAAASVACSLTDTRIRRTRSRSASYLVSPCRTRGRRSACPESTRSAVPALPGRAARSGRCRQRRIQQLPRRPAAAATRAALLLRIRDLQATTSSRREISCVSVVKTQGAGGCIERNRRRFDSDHRSTGCV